MVFYCQFMFRLFRIAEDIKQLRYEFHRTMMLQHFYITDLHRQNNR